MMMKMNYRIEFISSDGWIDQVTLFPSVNWEIRTPNELLDPFSGSSFFSPLVE